MIKERVSFPKRSFIIFSIRFGLHAIFHNMIQTNTKFLSYFWNENAQEKKLGRNNFYSNLSNEESTANLLMHVLFSLLVVISLSFGLRMIENTFFSTSPSAPSFLRIESAMAAELETKAEKVSQSFSTVNLKPGSAFTFTLKFKNTGTSTWTRKSVYLKSSTSGLKFRHDYWPDPYLPAVLKEASVAPGEIGTFVFALAAPSKLGTYSGDFLLVRDNVLIQNTDINVILNIVEDPSKPVVAITPVVNQENSSAIQSGDAATVPIVPAAAPVCTLNLKIANAVEGDEAQSCVVKFGLPEKGPDIRVGLFTMDEAITIRNDKACQVYDENDTLLASVPANTQITFNFIDSTKQYTFDFIDKTIRSTAYLKLKNFNNGIFEITSLKDVPTWNTSVNFNEFIGDLEIRYNDYRERAWLIETLSLEDYVKGIKETSNSDPLEYLKTMTVAARTYALYHHNSGTKHAKEFYDVDSYYDQVYKGNVVSQILPNLITATDETKGMVATFDNELIIAAYFARGDGKTRSFKEIWGRVVPYLISVITPYTQGKTLWGHGVGIDASDAKARASKDGSTYDSLLKHYYTGINLEKIY